MAQTPARDRARTERRILDAALALFGERGYHGAAVPAIAQRAGVGAGTIYRHHASKEDLVNAVFRDAKTRLRAALLDGLEVQRPPASIFLDLWQRLWRFACDAPDAFAFLELQDHVPYLDAKSRALELEVLAPIAHIARALQQGGGLRPVPVDLMMALVWGAFAGLVKSARMGYLTLDDERVTRAGEACWALCAVP